jgi:hypothetical protein
MIGYSIMLLFAYQTHDSIHAQTMFQASGVEQTVGRSTSGHGCGLD